MDIKEFKNIIFENAPKYEITDFELFYQKNKNFKVNIYEGEVEKYQNNLSEGVSFRGNIKGKTGYAYSEKIDEESAKFILESVKKNLQIIDSSEKEYIYAGDEKYPDVDVFCDKLENYNTDFKINLAKNVEKVAFQYDKRIISVESCFVGNGENEVYIANSKGVELFEKSNYAIVYISVTAEENGVKKTGSEFWRGKDFGPVDYVKIAENACRKALNLLGSRSVENGNKSVIFKNEAFADILTTFIGCFFAENSQKGFSLLKGKKGEKIASELVNIKDLPLLDDGFFTCGFDSEAVASYDKTIVENGELKTLLYNLKAAMKDNVKSTGNGFKLNYKSAVTTSATNFMFEAGNATFDELVLKLGDGIVVTRLSGLHSGADTVSGNFSLAADGFSVKEGRVTEPFEQVTVSGNFYNVLKEIEDISNDLYSDAGGAFGAVICPSVLVNNISIAS